MTRLLSVPQLVELWNRDTPGRPITSTHAREVLLELEAEGMVRRRGLLRRWTFTSLGRATFYHSLLRRGQA